MSRRLALVPILFLLFVAACDSKGSATTGAPATAPTATEAAPVTSAAPVSTSAKPSSKSTKAQQSGSTDPATGHQYALLRSGDAGTRQITYDLVEWYEGKQAVKACAEDGETEQDNDYCTGYYLRNNNKKLRTVPVAADSLIAEFKGSGLTKVSLATFLKDVPEDSTIQFWIKDGQVVRLEQIYLP
ncbi:hypothetical protein BJY16_007327 [Actinoplanes octamycinicus]|uniref:Lipoprotein n=1 Tax=Actinoplanes octamycinicus TaxID=135948 RepID=A0A7W7MB90_9ACTN|nr:hypothetical protein [Actinoplanes octamycinicus]MBB4743868.1 hypothetical protein [Actinoplanes octamycinicus]GIE58497.1 hypothetical protein Aoc01nite_38990 [Actinoplanes octamycinicus]